ncbi:hypothetical protein ACVIIW_006874 [Bradyrhizobium sp. USDA 4449]
MSVAASNLRRFLCATAMVAGLVACLNFAVDPLQLFHRARIFPAMYSSDDRMQAAGLIESQEFDAVFMGTSLAVHYRASEISRTLGVRAVKLAMSGSTSKEQSFVLKAALAKKPKLVIWQLDDWIFRNGPDIDQYMPTDYYRRNLKGLLSYLFSLSMARESLGIAARATRVLERLVLPLTWIQVLKFNNDIADDINTLPSYFNIRGTYNSRNALASFAHYKEHPKEISVGYDYGIMVRNFESDAVALIEANPNTQFRLYFTPYSILHFVAMREFSSATLELTYQLDAYIAQRLTQLPNVVLYDFRTAKTITHNLDNYLDIAHHSPEIDAEVLRRLAAGSDRVLPEDPLRSLEELKRQVSEYNPP